MKPWWLGSIFCCVSMASAQGVANGPATTPRRVLLASKRYGTIQFKAFRFEGIGKAPQNLWGVVELLEKSNEGQFVLVQSTEYHTKSAYDGRDFRSGSLRWILNFVAYSAERQRVWFTTAVWEGVPNITDHLYAWDPHQQRLSDLGEFHGSVSRYWPSPTGQYLLVCTAVRNGTPNVIWSVVDVDGHRCRELATSDDMTDRYRWLPGDQLADAYPGANEDGLRRSKGRIDVSQISTGWKPATP